MPRQYSLLCPQCDNPVPPWTGKKARIYCSDRCAERARRERVGIERTCEGCGEPFRAFAYAIEYGKAKYCSPSCAQKMRRGKHVEARGVYPRVPSVPYLSAEWIERFWSYVTKTDDCWEWNGARDPNGYGRLSAKGRSGLSHRAAWEIVGGPIPHGMKILHACDNPSCLRNDDEGWYEVNGILRPRRGHLFLGTQRDNVFDMIAKGRAPHMA